MVSDGTGCLYAVEEEQRLKCTEPEGSLWKVLQKCIIQISCYFFPGFYDSCGICYLKYFSVCCDFSQFKEILFFFFA